MLTVCEVYPVCVIWRLASRNPSLTWNPKHLRTVDDDRESKSRASTLQCMSQLASQWSHGGLYLWVVCSCSFYCECCMLSVLPSCQSSRLPSLPRPYDVNLCCISFERTKCRQLRSKGHRDRAGSKRRKRTGYRIPQEPQVHFTSLARALSLSGRCWNVGRLQQDHRSGHFEELS